MPAMRAACAVCLGLLGGTAGFRLQGQSRSAQPTPGSEYGLVHDQSPAPETAEAARAWPADAQAQTQEKTIVTESPGPETAEVAKVAESPAPETAEVAKAAPPDEQAKMAENMMVTESPPPETAEAAKAAPVDSQAKTEEKPMVTESPVPEVTNTVEKDEKVEGPKDAVHPRVGPRHPIHIGDSMEVIALKGPKKGHWIRCVVTGVDKNDLYQIQIPTNPKDARKMEGIPATALRHVSEQAEKSDGLLVFITVTGKPDSVKQVKKNVDHLRETYMDRADIYFVHDDGDKEAWLSSGAEWYNKNVQYSHAEVQHVPENQKPFASMLSAFHYYPPQVKLAKQLLAELLPKRQYDYVWLLDDNVDFSSTNLTQMIKDARSSDALIVSPSAIYNDTAQLLPNCGPWNRMCFLHKPKKGCQYRYTNFVQAMFPLIKPEALIELSKCESCDKIIDSVWCTKMARRFGRNTSQACAILDQDPVLYTNSKTLRMWEAAHSLVENNMEALVGVDDRVEPEDIREIECVRAA